MNEERHVEDKRNIVANDDDDDDDPEAISIGKIKADFSYFEDEMERNAKGW